MSISKEIEDIIRSALNPIHLEVINESHKHIGHAGHDGSGESHFKLIVVSSGFESYSRIQRHRRVNSLLMSLFDKGLHALSLNLKAPSEFNK